jgi:hypothetical protein
LQVAVQIVIGLAVTVFPTVTGAFALGMVEKDQLPIRIAGTQTLTHTGNVAFALAAGALGTLLALQGIFFAAAVFAFGMAPAVYFISSESVSYEAARAGGEENGDKKRAVRGAL